VISELFAEEVRCREGLLSPIFCDYLEAARASSPAPPITMEAIRSMCTARDRQRGRYFGSHARCTILLSPVCAAPAFSSAKATGNRRRLPDTMRHSQWLNLAGLQASASRWEFRPRVCQLAVQLIGRPYEDELVLSRCGTTRISRGAWQPPPLA